MVCRHVILIDGIVAEEGTIEVLTAGNRPKLFWRVVCVFQGFVLGEAIRNVSIYTATSMYGVSHITLTRLDEF